MEKINFIFKVIVSPLISILIPYVFLKSLVNFIKTGKLKYMGFDMVSSMNNYFYKTQKLNLDIFEKRRATPLLGFGNYHMSRLFYIPRISHNAFINLGPALTTVLFSLFNILICFMFYYNVDFKWLSIAVFFGYFSAINYSSSFTSQNYNTLAWFLFPIFVFSIINYNIYILIISVIGVFFLSFGVGLYLLIFFSFYVLFIDYSFYHFIFLFLILILISVYPLLKSKLAIKWFIETFLFVGISKKSSYSRSHQRFSMFNIYYTVLFSIPVIINIFLKNDYFFLIIFSYSIFIINQFFFRFMDRENPIYAFLISNLIFIILNPGIVNLITFIVIANPIPDSLKIRITNKKNKLFNIRIFKPFRYQELIKKIKIFSEKVPKNKTVLFAYNNPRNNYDRIFDGYRYVVETIYYYFQIRRVRSFPDWYAVWEENSNNKIIWGRNLESIYKNLKMLKTKYLVYYSDHFKIKDKKIKNNFRILANFNIKRTYSNESSLWTNKNKSLNFFLLEKK